MNKDQVKVFADKVYGDMAGAMAVGMAYVGVKTGLFHALAGKGHVSVADVVLATGLQPRYVEEWLNGMAAAGYLDYNAGAKTFQLPEEHAYLVASEGTDHFMGGLFYFAPLGGCPHAGRLPGDRNCRRSDRRRSYLHGFASCYHAGVASWSQHASDGHPFHGSYCGVMGMQFVLIWLKAFLSR
jgi:Rv2258c-like winged HTH domain